MQPLTWILLPALWLAVAMVGSYVAGLRGWDKLQGFKTCLLWGPLGVLRVAFGKEPVPDVEVKCPHCGRRQVISGDLDRFECGQCWRYSDVLRPVV